MKRSLCVLSGGKSLEPLWLEDPRPLDWVCEQTTFAGTRRRRPSWCGGSHLVGYAVLAAAARAEPGLRGTFRRRIFTMSDDEIPPGDAVNPLPVAPNTPGERIEFRRRGRRDRRRWDPPWGVAIEGSATGTPSSRRVVEVVSANDRVAHARVLGYLATQQSESGLRWRYLDDEVRRCGFGVAISARRRYADVIVLTGEQLQLDEEGKRDAVALGRQ